MSVSPVRLDIDLWLFDLDGVLVDTTRCHRRAYEELWRHVGVSGPSYDRIAGRRTGDVVVEVTTSLAPTPTKLREWTMFKQQWARDCLTREDIAFPDSADCIRVLKERGTLALGTGASRATTDVVLARYGWSESFAVTVTADDVRQGKPEPDVYVAAMQQSGFSPRRTLVIEDSEAGLAAAIASGAYAASVRSGLVVPSEQFVGSFPDLLALMTAFGPDRE